MGAKLPPQWFEALAEDEGQAAAMREIHEADRSRNDAGVA